MAEITRETLTLAALAAGMRVATGYVTAHDDLTAIALESGEEWRPHTDPGDAARLAVRMNFEVLGDENASSAATGDGQISHGEWHDGTEPDKLRAWREAVTLCAAAVGEQMRDER